MKIAVCVKHVPEGALEASTRLEAARPLRRGRAQPFRRERGRGGAAPQGRLRHRGRRRVDGAGEGGRLAAQGARDGRRPRRARDRRGARRLRPRRDEQGAREGARARGAPTSCCSASRRATPTAPCCGPRSPSGCGRPVVSQAAELSIADGTVRVKRQTEFGYDMIEAPLPAVVAVSDAINEPRYPSLKGIMGAKKKPPDTLSLADLGVDAGEVGRGRLEDRSARARRAAGARRRAQDRGRRQRRAGDRRLPRGEETRSDADSRLPRASRRRAAEGLARRAREGSGARRRRRRRRARRRRREGARRARPAQYGAAKVLRRRGRRARAAAAAAARRRARARSCRTAATTPCSSRTRCSPPTSRQGSRRASTPG